MPVWCFQLTCQTPCFSPLVSSTGDVWVASDHALSAIWELGSLRDQEEGNQKILLKIPTITTSLEKTPHHRTGKKKSLCGSRDDNHVCGSRDRFFLLDFPGRSALSHSLRMEVLGSLRGGGSCEQWALLC